jgi:hypothetical protein
MWIAAAVLACAGPALADDAAARSVIEKALKAHGGDLAEGVIVVKSKGTVFAGGQEIAYSGTTFYSHPKQRVELTFEAGGMSMSLVSVFTGEQGWVKLGQMLVEMTKDQVAEAREQMYAGRVGQLRPLLKEAGFQLSVIGEDKVGDRAVVGIRIARDKHRDVRLYFDKETWLTLKIETSIVPDGGSNEVEQITVLSDYKKTAEGVMYPGKIVMHRAGEKFLDGDVTEYKRLDKADDAWFTKPD